MAFIPPIFSHYERQHDELRTATHSPRIWIWRTSTSANTLAATLHSMMMVAMKQVYGYVIWFALGLAALFLLCDIPAVRTNIRKVPAGRFMPSSIFERSKGAGKAEDFIGSDITALRICFWANSDIRVTASGTTRTEDLR